MTSTINSLAPASLNGYPVIERVDHLNGFTTVMCYRARHAAHPYVVASWYPALGETWAAGDYLATPTEAAEAYKARAKFDRVSR